MKKPPPKDKDNSIEAEDNHDPINQKLWVWDYSKEFARLAWVRAKTNNPVRRFRYSCYELTDKTSFIGNFINASKEKPL